MKIISSRKITEIVSDLCVKANRILRSDVLTQLKSARHREKNPGAKKILDAIIKNAFVAQREELAICQDTGMPCVFVEAGAGVRIQGDLKTAINRGIEAGYKKGYFRNSLVRNPLLRGACGYVPAVIHTDIVKGSKIKITVLPKGFGSENKTKLKMFTPTAALKEIKDFILESVKSAGPDACPPFIVGVGIGGTADYACLLAKKALLNRLTGRPADRQTEKLQRELLSGINKLNIGPMGLGGKTTALGVNIEIFPTHIAGLPVCVNISCHALRSAAKII